MTTLFDNPLMAALFTDSTCGDACWSAREDICRCSCGGRNHGIDRRAGERPERMKRKGNARYRLIAITDYSTAKNMEREDYQTYLREHLGDDRDTYYNDYDRYYRVSNRYNERVISNMATTSQRKWREVIDANLVDQFGRCDAYLVWERAS